jgi:hypothetical protein
MHLQLAFREADLKVGLDGLRLLLRPAVYQPVIRIPTPRKLRVRPRHPEIERIVQEEICQYWADDTPNAKDNLETQAMIGRVWSFDRCLVRPDVAGSGSSVEW